jgi:group I intron endonuclease
MKPYGIIYKATNVIDGKSYVGYTTTTRRKYQHYYAAKSQDDVNNYFYNAIRLHGYDNFKWEVLKECDNQLMLNLMETFMIMVHHTHWTEGGYNMTWGGDGMSGYKHSKQSIEKMKIIAQIRCLNPEYLNKLKKPKGKQQPEHTEKLKNISLLKWQDVDYRNIQIKSHTGRVHPEVQKIKITAGLCKKKYIVMCPDGNIIDIINLSQYCRQNNLNSGCMSRVANKKLPSHKGYKILNVIKNNCLQ